MGTAPPDVQLLLICLKAAPESQYVNEVLEWFLQWDGRVQVLTLVNDEHMRV